MKKFKEVQRTGFTTKWYFKEEKDTIIDLMNRIKSAEGLTVNYVQVDEDVELDAKEVAGSYNIDSFISNYEDIKAKGIELSYKMVITYNDLNLLVDFHEDSNLVVLSTPEPSLEIDDLIQKKTDSLTF